MVLGCLYDHLVDTTGSNTQLFLHIGELPVQPSPFLHPKLFNPVLHHGILDANREGGEKKEAGKKDFSSMGLYQPPQLKQLLL